MSKKTIEYSSTDTNIYNKLTSAETVSINEMLNDTQTAMMRDQFAGVMIIEDTLNLTVPENGYAIICGSKLYARLKETTK